MLDRYEATKNEDYQDLIEGENTIGVKESNLYIRIYVDAQRFNREVINYHKDLIERWSGGKA